MPQLKFPLVSIHAGFPLLAPSLLYPTPPSQQPLARFYSSHILANSVYLSNFCHLWPTYFEVSPSVCRTPHTPHHTLTHTQSLHTRPHNNNSIAQPSSPPLFPPLNRLETEPRLCLNFVNYLRIQHLQLVRILIFDSSLKCQQQQQH